MDMNTESGAEIIFEHGDYEVVIRDGDNVVSLTYDDVQKIMYLFHIEDLEGD